MPRRLALVPLVAVHEEIQLEVSFGDMFFYLKDLIESMVKEAKKKKEPMLLVSAE